MDFYPSFPLTMTPIMTVGLLLLIGTLGGYIAHKLSWLPSITGFLLVGFVFGEGGIGLLSDSLLAQSHVLIDIALGLIMYKLGVSLDIHELRKSTRLLITSLIESTFSFIVVLYILHFFHIPGLVAALVAAICISSSPAILLHIAHEVGAKGKITESAKTMVAFNNVFAFVVFSCILPFVHYSLDAPWTTILFQPTYRLLGSLIIGVIFAYGLYFMAKNTQSAKQYKLALVLGSIMFTLGVSEELKLSMLFVPMVVGITLRSLDKENTLSQIEFGNVFELFFILLFVFAGANLHLPELIQYAPAIFSLVFFRSLIKLVATATTSTFYKQPLKEGVASGLLLIPMAGLAIGLVQTSRHLFPDQAPMVAALVLGSVTILETFGPLIVVFAFKLAGETSAQLAQQEIITVEQNTGSE